MIITVIPFNALDFQAIKYSCANNGYFSFYHFWKNFRYKNLKVNDHIFLFEKN